MVKDIMELYPNKTLEEVADLLRPQKQAELKSACDSAILTTQFSAAVQGTTYNFSYDREAQSNFSGAGYLFQRSLIASIDWTAYLDGERTRITINQNDFDVIAVAAAQFCQSYIDKYSGLISQLNDATDPYTVNSIVWS